MQCMNTYIATIILAAGSSSRMGMGRHKLLLPLGNQPVLAHALDAALASQARPIVVVLGHQAEQVSQSIATYNQHPAIKLVENLDYQQGMSTSLRVGIRHIMYDDELAHTITAALILLGDQPLMTAQIINALLATRQTTQKRIIVPLYAGKRGNPVLFDASLFPELVTVSGDEGGRRVIEQHRQDVATVELGGVMARYDVDTWETYEQVVAEWQRSQRV